MIEQMAAAESHSVGPLVAGIKVRALGVMAEVRGLPQAEEIGGGFEDV